jgi:hypothetical protein
MKLGPRRPRPERKNPRRSRGSRSGARGTRTPDLLGAIQAGVRADFVVSAGYLCRSRAQVGGRDFTHFPTISARIGPRTAVFGPTPRPRAPDDEERRRTHVAEGPSMHRGLRETRPTHRAGGDSQSPTTRRCRAGGRWRAGASSVTARPSSFAGTEARQQRPPYAANTVSNQPRCAGDHAKVRIVDQAANARTGTPRVFVWSAKTDPACGWLARSSGDRPFRAVVM